MVSPDPTSELVGTLSKLNDEWQAQQNSKSSSSSRWTKLVLPKDEQDNENDFANQEGTTSTSDMAATMFGAAAATTREDDFVYLLEPTASSVPSCLVVFLGGAGLGQFPQIAYNEFLMRVSDRLNAAIITAPYSVGLDHFTMAKETGERIRKAILYCEDERGYRSTLPTYCLGHSLGCKLQTIYMGATGQDYEGIGFISFNNFGFSQTITMARSFAEELRTKNSNSRGVSDDDIFGGAGGTEDIMNNLFNMAEMAVGSLGIEFTPSPTDTERIISIKYDERLQERTRLFVFDKDNLDSSESFLTATSTTDGRRGIKVSSLPGTHLSPVYFRFNFDELDLPQETMGMAQEAVGGFQSASFGNEGELDALVDEVCGFIVGKPPSRSSSEEANDGVRRLPGAMQGQ